MTFQPAILNFLLYVFKKFGLNPVFKFALEVEGYSPLYSKLRSRNPDGQTGEGDDEGIRGRGGRDSGRGRNKVKGGGVGGGVGMFIDIRYESEIVDRVSTFIPKIFKSMYVKVKLTDSKHLLIGNIYRPPQSNILELTTHLNDILVKIKDDKELKSCELILVGDFNIDLLKTDTHVDTSKYFDTLLENNLLPVISKPTRITHSSATLIDHIFVQNLSDNSKSGILLESLSDHCPVYFLMGEKFKCNKTKPDKIRTRVKNENNKAKFYESLSSHNWSEVLNENRPKQAFTSFLNTVDKLYEESFPFIEKTRTVKNSPVNPWMSSALLKSRKRKQVLYSRKIARPTQHNIQQFKDYSNLYKSLCRAAKQSYYSSKIESLKNNARQTWKVIRELLGNIKDKSQTPEYFIESGNIIKGNLNIAEGFNKFFCEIGPKLSEKIPPSNKSYKDFLNNHVEENFVFKNLNVTDINEIGINNGIISFIITNFMRFWSRSVQRQSREAC